METILITGSQGFCGSHLTTFLKKSSQTKVLETGIHGSSTQKSRSSSFYPIDILDSKKVQLRLSQISQLHGIFHLAAQSIPSLALSQLQTTVDVNFFGTLNMLDACKRHHPKAKFLFFSSTHVYGQQPRRAPLKETDPVDPDSAYAFSKYLGERACWHAYEQNRLPIIILRPSNIVGPGLSEQLVLSNWCAQVARFEMGEKPRILHVGNLKLKRAFLPIGDAVQAFVTAYKKGTVGEIYHVASEELHSLSDYLDFIAQKSKVSFKVRVNSSRIRVNDALKVKISTSKIRKLGWTPRQNIFSEIESLLAYWRTKV